MVNISTSGLVTTEVRGVVWTIQAGHEGQWRALEARFHEQDAAIEHLEWCRVHAPRSVSHRLIRETTTVTTEIEDV